MAKKGFFDEEDYLPPLKEMKVQTYNGCDDCDRDKKSIIKYQGEKGRGEKGILIIPEKPGNAGAEKTILRNLGIDLMRDCIVAPAVGCSGTKENPTDVHIGCCRPGLQEAIERHKPKVIIPMGIVSLKALYFGRMAGDAFGNSNKWRGFRIPDRTWDAWVCPTLPSFYVHKDETGIAQKLLESDLKAAVAHLQLPLPAWKDEASQIIILESLSEVEAYLQDILMSRSQHVALDWETTGLKPYREGHRIVAASFCYKDDEAVAFKVRPEYEPIIKRVLASKRVGKMAHNMKFEHNWGRATLGVSTENWTWDSMLAAHIIDNRPGITGLKFQSFVKFGLLGYQDGVDDFLSATDAMKEVHGGNAFNRIHSAPIKDLLLYNGIDSLVERRLALEQMPIIEADEGLSRAYELFHNGTSALASAEFNGFRIDDKVCMDTMKSLKREIRERMAILNETDIVQQWKSIYQGKFKLTSDDQLAHILYEVMGLESGRETDSGKKSVDKMVLADFAEEVPLVADILYIRKLRTLKNTFLAGIERECSDDMLHTFYDLNKVETGRSSSSAPNWQNLPIRDPEASKYVRSLVFPHPGHMLGEIDFSGIEVKVACCVTGDTEVSTIDGSQSMLRVIERISKGESVFVYAYDFEKSRIAVKRVLEGGKTGEGKEVWRIAFDNEQEIRATPDHKFLLRSGKYRKLRDLKPGDSLMPFYKKVKKSNYSVNYHRIYLNNGEHMLAHNLIAEDVLGQRIAGSKMLVHHKDSNGCNNSIENIEVMSRKEHMRIHSIQGWKNNPESRSQGSWMKSPEARSVAKKRNEERKESWTPEDWDEFGDRISEALKRRGGHSGARNPMYGRAHSEETREKIAASKRGKTRNAPHWSKGLTKDTDSRVRSEEHTSELQSQR